MSDWIDPDDAPELTAELAEVAELRVGGKVVRPATGYLGPNGVVRGRPPLRDAAKRQVTLRLDPDVIEKFREGGPGWQARMNEALRKAVGLG
ncbi:BrnA antitoxin family protein [Sphingomonas radiodurans]|uniref:BrnA antitoxin family protein n=1 Tax=Sphingomonas radiodurans TaxID=2890321 RepID=UPI001E3A7A19|nr:BrnA antitoxin family protein [Sphingomonas radiodurans]WBH17457.1 BrnA antitoxin family protein [Sphingomonas radiodurans]